MIPVVVAAVFAAAFVQSVAGFGFALLAVPVMATAIDPRVAVVVSTVLGIMSTSAQATQDRRHVEPVLARRLILSSLVGMPLGLVVFLVVDVAVLRIALGLAVLGAVALLARELDLRHVSPRMDVALGTMSGVLATSLSTNGPPLVFDLHSRRLAPERFRATLSAVLAASGVASLVLFALARRIDAQVLRAASVGLPALLAGYLLGRWVRPWLDAARFRSLVLVLLSAAAVSTLVAGVVG